MKHFFCILLIAALTLCIFVGCNDSTGTSSTAATASTMESAAETTAAATETTTEAATDTTAETTAAAAETTTEAATDTTAEAPATQPASLGNSSELLEGLTLEDAAIVIDGVLYKSEDPYSLLVENGWDFSFEDYNIDEDYVLNKGEYIYSTVHLKNPTKYGDKYANPEITIGFINNADTVKPLKECSIHGIEVDGSHGFRRFEDDPSGEVSCYDFEIIKGLRRGSSMEDVKAAWGEPEDVYVADGDDYHYEQLTYQGDHVTYKLKVFTKPEIGLQGVSISDTRNWTR